MAALKEQAQKEGNLDAMLPSITEGALTDINGEPAGVLPLL